MEKKYFVDVYFFNCPKCKQPAIGGLYFHVYQRAEIGAAKRTGLVSYKCQHCHSKFQSDSLLTNGEVSETTKEEAVSRGIDFESSILA